MSRRGFLAPLQCLLFGLSEPVVPGILLGGCNPAGPSCDWWYCCLLVVYVGVCNCRLLGSRFFWRSAGRCTLVDEPGPSRVQICNARLGCSNCSCSSIGSIAFLGHALGAGNMVVLVATVVWIEMLSLGCCGSHSIPHIEWGLSVAVAAVPVVSQAVGGPVSCRPPAVLRCFLVEGLSVAPSSPAMPLLGWPVG